MKTRLLNPLNLKFPPRVVTTCQLWIDGPADAAVVCGTSPASPVPTALGMVVLCESHARRLAVPK